MLGDEIQKGHTLIVWRPDDPEFWEKKEGNCDPKSLDLNSRSLARILCVVGLECCRRAAPKHRF